MCKKLHTLILEKPATKPPATAVSAVTAHKVCFFGLYGHGGLVGMRQFATVRV